MASSIHDIKHFEQNLEKIGISTKFDNKIQPPTTLLGTPTENLVIIQQRVKEAHVKSSAESKRMMNTLKEKNVDISQARVEREKRRSKQSSDERTTQDSTKEAKIGEEILVEILKRTVERHEAVEKQTQSKKTKEKEFTARILKHEEFVEKREREYADAQRRSKIVTPTSLMEKEDKLASDLRTAETNVTEYRKRKFYKHYQIFYPLALEIIDTALDISEYEQEQQI
ncbi:MAG: hypothetical protein EZS28_015467 [Streblomastix strix]|uniref:Uncharacterized protein n=1 Tax=Streblomastix strix TaxID=222440 RepID=A0A5J4W1Z3_9EUKA|nr:MAG: hypothetical protein EZS28_015467 [Streblomastix strix]